MRYVSITPYASLDLVVAFSANAPSPTLRGPAHESCLNGDTAFRAVHLAAVDGLLELARRHHSTQ
jgi:hypothetical protein